MEKLRSVEKKIVDTAGRHVLLHGVNLVCKDKERGYIGNWTRREFHHLRSIGMNVVRLGILWAGLEPDPGRYDESYLDRLEGILRLADEAGMCVFLDMHQDLYGEQFADGAPGWATLCDGAIHDASGSVWSDAYLNSQAVQTAFDRFWANAPAPDGIGLREHYARAWRHVAERFGAFGCVVGYDIMNEPFPGSAAMEIEEAMIHAFLSLQQEASLQEADGSTTEDLDVVDEVRPQQTDGVAEPDMASVWMDPEGRAAILSVLTDPVVYEIISQRMEPALHRFDRAVLTPFFQQVADAIREVDTETLLFLEASYFSNMGVRSGITPVMRNGHRDPQQIYAPHGYDLIVDTTANDLWSPARVDVIFRHHAEVSDAHGWPMLVGEWGAFWENADGVGCGTEPQAEQLRVVFEQTLCGDTFWCYPDEGVEKQNVDGFRYSNAIVRGLPLAVNGTLLSYQWLPEAKTLSLVWLEGESAADTLLWVPGHGCEVSEALADGSKIVPRVHRMAEERGTRLAVPAGNPGVERRLLVRHN